jgi:NCS1 family nucleobase:cation symporter-1
MIVDYYFIRRQQLLVTDLYERNGSYSYSNGFNYAAIAALLIAIAPNVPGFLVQIKMMDAASFPAWLVNLYNYAWFVGFGVSAIVYGMLMSRSARVKHKIIA